MFAMEQRAFESQLNLLSYAEQLAVIEYLPLVNKIFAASKPTIFLK